MAACTDLDVSAPDPHHNTKTHYSYSPSGESTASSSSSSSASSVLSIDAPSSQSSVSPGSVDSSREEWTNENEDQYYNAGYSRRGSSDSSDGEAVITTGLSDGGVVISYAHEEDLVIASDTSFCHATQVHPIIEAVAPEVRKHPRRTQRLNSGESQDGKTTTACPRPPPSLVRQSERKDNFVDSLVGKLTCFRNLERRIADETTTSKTLPPR